MSRNNVLVKSILTVIYHGETKYYNCRYDVENIATLRTVLTELKNCNDFCEIYIGIERYKEGKPFYGYKIENIIRGHCIIYQIRNNEYTTIAPEEVTNYFVRW